MPNPEPIPKDDEIAQPPRLENGQPNPNAYRAGDTWLQYLAGMSEQLAANATALTTESVSAQNASIAATDITQDVLPAGLYRVTWYAEITAAAVTSSSLTVTIGYTHNGGAKTFVGTALTGNTTATVGSETKSFLIDAASPITYSTTYASNGAGEMQYSLVVWLEAAGEA